MAEIMIFYSDLEKYINSAIEEIKDPKLKEETSLYKTEILAALTVPETDEHKNSDCTEPLSLWHNKENLPAQKAKLLLESYYIQLEEVFLEKIRCFIAEGIISIVLRGASFPMPPSAVHLDFSIKEKAVELFTSVFMSIRKLNDFECCLYHHVAEHLISNAQFTQKEFNNWIPKNREGSCDMCTFNKGCGFYDKSGDRCKYRDDHSECDALNLLMDRGIVCHIGQETYKFLN